MGWDAGVIDVDRRFPKPNRVITNGWSPLRIRAHHNIPEKPTAVNHSCNNNHVCFCLSQSYGYLAAYAGLKPLPCGLWSTNDLLLVQANSSNQIRRQQLFVGRSPSVHIVQWSNKDRPEEKQGMGLFLAQVCKHDHRELCLLWVNRNNQGAGRK
jgi:hypothetical protein